MATFRVGQQTDPGVLLQRQALEPVGADNPGAGTKRLTGARVRVPGAEHGRGEIPAASPGGGSVTPEPSWVGEKHREVHPFVFVLDRHGQPLQPCAPARARRLLKSGRAVVASGGRTKWNRTRAGMLKTHTLDALSVGKLDTITETVRTVLVAGCSGRGAYARTRTDKYGFPRLRLPRQKQFFGFQTGDLARAIVPTGKYAGTHTGRVAVRATGSFALRTAHGLVTARHKHFRLPQRADGYAYTNRPESEPGQ